MPKPPPAGKCVYCLQKHEKLTWDHVFPTSWYPKSTPPKLEKWCVPCCQQCNQKYSKIEEDLLVRLGICVDRDDPRAHGITEKVMRSVDPKSGRNQRDQNIRLRKRGKLISEIERIHEIPEIGVLPNFGAWPIPETGLGTVRIAESDLITFGLKLVRGFTYVLSRSFISDDYKIEIIFAEHKKADFFVDMVKKFGTTHYRGPGLEVTRAEAADDPHTAGFFIKIWGRLEIYGFILQKGHDVFDTLNTAE